MIQSVKNKIVYKNTHPNYFPSLMPYDVVTACWLMTGQLFLSSDTNQWNGMKGERQVKLLPRLSVTD